VSGAQNHVNRAPVQFASVFFSPEKKKKKGGEENAGPSGENLCPLRYPQSLFVCGSRPPLGAAAPPLEKSDGTRGAEEEIVRTIYHTPATSPMTRDSVGEGDILSLSTPCSLAFSKNFSVTG
jgi:hypothetical protein